MTDFDTLKYALLDRINAAQTAADIEAVRVQILGKKGELSALMRGIGALDPAARRERGAQLNILKEDVTQALLARKAEMEQSDLNARLAKESIDPSLMPPRQALEIGRLHPITQTIDEVVAILGEMHFKVVEGPDIEDDFHNFTALNIPADHPARQMHDTFYLPVGEDGQRPVLRTHTSPVQIRTLQKMPPPLRVMAPGRVYRSDSDMTHTPMFHQIEALVIEESVHMGHLKGCVSAFCRAFFEIDDLPLRFRPSFFPFTEPSAEVDIGCSRAEGVLKIGHGGDWLEIMGCGMVHPNVLTACGIDPERWRGFAFGLGVERIAMLKYGIADLRTFFESDLRWLTHYGFSPLDTPSMTGGFSP